MPTTKLVKILFISNLITLGALIGTSYLLLKNTAPANQYNQVSQDTTPDDTPLKAYNPVTYTGIIRKERIPEEYALGDWWYILYFDTPQLLDTAYGRRYEKSIQVQESTIKSFDAYLDTNVIVEGRLGTGYAESLVVLVDNIKKP